MTAPVALGPLDACVHCGFCLPACPTYLATGDENDSPRGRIVLMRALEAGELLPTDPDLRRHLDRCLGCRGCEPACPSGVEYGRGLEAARARLRATGPRRLRERLLLLVFRYRPLWRFIFSIGRLLRSLRLAPRMVAATGRQMPIGDAHGSRLTAHSRSLRGASGAEAITVALFSGCVQDVLFSHVHQATRRVLEANGYRVVTPPGQVCCGAPHTHAGDTVTARDLLARNATLLDGVSYIVTNSAGCGAQLKDAGHLLDSGAGNQFGARVKDVSELLAEAGPRKGAPVGMDVAYDPPCHLIHAQGVHDQVLAMLAAIPELRVRVLPGAERCCGSAGTFSLLEPDLSADVLAPKLEGLATADPRPELVITGNPGCIMQIGTGLRTAGLPIGVAHPIELLDLSYRRAGFYDRD